MSRDPRWFDREAKRWLDIGPDQAPEHVIEAALLSIDSTAQEGRLRRWLIGVADRRGRGVMAAALATAALIAVVVITPMAFDRPPRPGSPGTIPPTTCGVESPVPSGAIATIAGNGAGGYAGDGGPAIAASIDTGQGIAVDRDGSVYFSDPAARAVRRVSLDGIVSTVIGPTTGGPLEQPQGLAFGPDGALYVADYGAGRIWRVDPEGAITPVAGDGVQGSSGNDRPALEARIQPLGLAVGPGGELYFDDAGALRMVDPNGVVRSLPGGASSGPGPSVSGIAVDRTGRVYLGDPGSRRIHVMDDEGGTTTFGLTGQPDGLGSSAPDSPEITDVAYSIAADEFGNVYVSEYSYFSEFQTGRIWRIEPGGKPTLVAGSGSASTVDCGPATGAGIASPQAIAVRNGILYIADSNAHQIRIVVL